MSMSWKNTYRLNECGICHKGVYFFQPQMSVEDEYVTAVWHLGCARDYDEWARLIANQISIESFEYEPDEESRLNKIQNP